VSWRAGGGAAWTTERSARARGAERWYRGRNAARSRLRTPRQGSGARPRDVGVFEVMLTVDLLLPAQKTLLESSTREIGKRSEASVMELPPLCQFDDLSESRQHSRCWEHNAMPAFISSRIFVAPQAWLHLRSWSPWGPAAVAFSPSDS